MQTLYLITAYIGPAIAFLVWGIWYTFRVNRRKEEQELKLKAGFERIMREYQEKYAFLEFQLRERNENTRTDRAMIERLLKENDQLKADIVELLHGHKHVYNQSAICANNLRSFCNDIRVPKAVSDNPFLRSALAAIVNIRTNLPPDGRDNKA